MPHRYFTTEVGGGLAALTGDDAHHLARVMRARPGQQVILCDGQGTEYLATVTHIQPDGPRVEFSVTPGYPSAAEPGLDITLFVACPKQDKLADIIRHSVELGTRRIVPFVSRWCVAALRDPAKKTERYNRIAVEAAKQCGRGVLPEVADTLPRFEAVCEAFAQYDRVLFFYEGGGVSLRQAAAGMQGKRLALVTGSEGGFAPEEAEAAARAGAVTVGLGPRILRCETAPLAALAAVLCLNGALE